MGSLVPTTCPSVVFKYATSVYDILPTVVVVVPGVLTEMGIENGTLNILPLLGSLPTWHSWSRWIDTVRSSIIEHERVD